MNFIPPDILLGAYAQGVFPMAEEGDIYWFSPEKRGVIPVDERFHIPRGLRKALRKNPYQVRCNTAFREVMLACGEREETWIDDNILESYCALYKLGFGYSFECWDEEGLQGGALWSADGQCLFWRIHVQPQG